MTDNASVNQAEDQSPVDSSDWPLWVIEGRIDLPCRLPPNESGVPATSLQISLGADDPDGFVQMRARAPDQIQQMEWWEANARAEYDCRGLVRACDSMSAMMRGSELFEHLADRLTVWSGAPVEVLGIVSGYNETMLRKCVEGTLTEFECTLGGQHTFRINNPLNTVHNTFFRPRPDAVEAMRWLRHAMLSQRVLEQYLFYYIALESLAKAIPGVVREPRRNETGEVIDGVESIENAAIKYLLQRRGLPASGKGVLARIRARIAHGNTDWNTIDAAHANMPVVQRLLTDALALVHGIDPNSVSLMPPSPLRGLVPIGFVAYTNDSNPLLPWGGFLSDAHARYLTRVVAND